MTICPMSSCLRLRLAFKNFQFDSGKSCWFLLDRNSCGLVSDFHSLIKKRFGLSSDIRCFLKDCLLPAEEGIELIRDEDEITIEELVNYDKMFSASTESTVGGEDATGSDETAQQQKRKHKKSKHKKDQINSQKADSNLKRKRKHEIDGGEVEDKAPKKKKIDLLLCSTKENELISDTLSKADKKKLKKQRKKKSKWDVKDIEQMAEEVNAQNGLSSDSRPLVKKKKKKGTKEVKKQNLKEPKEKDLVSIVSKGFLEIQKNEMGSSEDSKNVPKASAVVKVKSKSKEMSENNKHVQSVKFDSALKVTEKPKIELPKTPHISSGRKLEVAKKTSNSNKSETKNWNTHGQNSFVILGKEIKSPHKSAKLKDSHIYFGSDEENAEEEISRDESSSLVVDSPQILKIMAQKDLQRNVSTVYDNSSKLSPVNNVQLGDTNIKENNNNSDLIAKDPANNKPINLKDYSSYPSLQGTPRIGDKIAYKILELSFSYTPEISDYKEAEVLSFDNASNVAKLCLDEACLQRKEKEADESFFRKFELPSDDEENNDNLDDPRLVEVDWKDILNPVLL